MLHSLPVPPDHLDQRFGVLRRGEVALDGGSARGNDAGVGMLAGELSLRRFAIVGPAHEAGISVAGGSASLEGVVVRAPGPSGISVSGAGRLDGRPARRLQGFSKDTLLYAAVIAALWLCLRWFSGSIVLIFSFHARQ